jgi:hypothetical protein
MLDLASPSARPASMCGKRNCDSILEAPVLGLQKQKLTRVVPVSRAHSNASQRVAFPGS